MARGRNYVHLRGFTGADPEMYHGDGFTIANIRLATDEGYTNREGEKVEHTEWHNVVAKNGLAEVFEKYIPKGSHVEVTGRLRTESWEDDEGNTRYRTKVHINDLTIISTPRDGDEGNSSEAKPATKATKAKATRKTRKKTTTKATAEADSGLPY